MNRLTVFLVLASLFFTQGFLVPPIHAVSGVDVLSTSGFFDFVGFYHVVGEVQNTGDIALSSVKITATFYDASDEVVGALDAYTALDVLLPGRKSPFEILFIDISRSGKIDHYRLDLQYVILEPPFLIGLEILSNSSREDDVGMLHVEGEIKNVGADAATGVKVAATFYDAKDTVVAAAVTPSSPRNLDPNENANFDIVLIYTSRVHLVTSYSLTAESEQYAIVPEYRALTGAVILIGLALAAKAFCLKRGKPSTGTLNSMQ